MDVDDFFNSEPEQPNIMDSEEFFNKTKKLLTNFLNNYSQAWINRSLKDNEFPDESVCEKCTGCGSFKMENGEEGECFQSNSGDGCYQRFFDYEQFGLEAETHLDEIMELVSVDKINSINL
jgi:hypothetical protein